MDKFPEKEIRENGGETRPRPGVKQVRQLQQKILGGIFSLKFCHPEEAIPRKIIG